MTLSSSKPIVGIIGGGQLALMLVPELKKHGAQVWVLDQAGAPAEKVADHFVIGDLENFSDVVAFGENCDRITIEIEKANTKALLELEQRGKIVRPQASLVELIQDKGRQKLFFRERQIPSADFLILDSRADLQSKSKFLPAVQKLRIGGYDGRGVKILNQAVDAASAFDAPSVLEKKIDLALELAVIVCRASDGSFRSFDPVGMVVDPKLNLLDHLIAPAEVSQDLLKEAVRLAELVANAFGITGILAVEMFLSRSGELLINEVAPRPHNSGHHTIEACPSSQYDQLARILLDLPLGETSASSPALLFNLLGEPGNTGQAVLMGKDQAEKITGVRVHDYGKIETKPGRKMGHLTILGKDAKELRQKLASVRGLVKYLAKEES